jgi:uncharacterized membrane protein
MEQYVQTAPSNTESNLFELQIDHEVSSHLRETAKWAKFLSIVGFVGLGLLLVFVIIMGTVAYSYSPFTAALPTGGGVMQVILLVAMIALYFFPCLFMFQFANKMLQALRNNDQYTLVASFRQLKLCYKYIGILTLILISIYVLVFVIGILIAVTR